jgi:hypothetical protein
MHHGAGDDLADVISTSHAIRAEASARSSTCSPPTDHFASL